MLETDLQKPILKALGVDQPRNLAEFFFRLRRNVCVRERRAKKCEIELLEGLILISLR